MELNDCEISMLWGLHDIIDQYQSLNNHCTLLGVEMDVKMHFSERTDKNTLIKIYITSNPSFAATVYMEIEQFETTFPDFNFIHRVSDVHSFGLLITSFSKPACYLANKTSIHLFDGK